MDSVSRSYTKILRFQTSPFNSLSLSRLTSKVGVMLILPSSMAGRSEGAGDQPWLIQGIQSGDGVGDLFI